MMLSPCCLPVTAELSAALSYGQRSMPVNEPESRSLETWRCKVPESVQGDRVEVSTHRPARLCGAMGSRHAASRMSDTTRRVFMGSKDRDFVRGAVAGTFPAWIPKRPEVLAYRVVKVNS